MTYSREVEQEIAWEALMEAWHDLHEAHLALEGLDPDNMDSFAWEQVADVQHKANEYFKAVQKWEKLLKKRKEGQG